MKPRLHRLLPALVICLIISNIGLLVYGRQEKHPCMAGHKNFILAPELMQAKLDELNEEGYCVGKDHIQRLNDSLWKISVTAEDLSSENTRPSATPNILDGGK